MKRYGRGLHSKRRTKTRQVAGSEFDNFATGRGRYCQPSLASLVACHLLRLMLVDVYLVGGKKRLPCRSTYTITGFPRSRGSLRIWMENALHLRLERPPNSCEEA
jgi:hypothetical protein